MLGLIRQDGTITIAQMIQKAQVSEITIKRELAVLKQLGIIQREGGRKEGRWKILNHDL